MISANDENQVLAVHILFIQRPKSVLVDIRYTKYFVCLIFVGKGRRRKINAKNFAIYSICCEMCKNSAPNQNVHTFTKVGHSVCLVMQQIDSICVIGDYCHHCSLITAHFSFVTIIYPLILGSDTPISQALFRVTIM